MNTPRPCPGATAADSIIVAAELQRLCHACKKVPVNPQDRCDAT